MTPLLEPMKGRELTAADRDLLQGEGMTAIVAGRSVAPASSSVRLTHRSSDTTSATLIYIIYELTRHPEQVRKLRDELSPHMAGGPRGALLNQDIVHNDHLNAVINETLRLHPPVPSRIARITPPEGLLIGETRIPGGIKVSAPQYTLGRSELLLSTPYRPAVCELLIYSNA